nr:3'(2'),5'-bisphosphate nucleotidase CysQ [Bacteroidia bacterium]
MDANTLLHLAIKAALFAGEDIMRVYKTDFSFERKADNTPVTLADMLASKRIVEILSVSSIPSISEEEPLPEFELRKTWERVWIIDPLDGTKEFIKKNGEFTVNIALVQNQHPVIGVIYVPVFNQLYFASAETGSYLATGSPDALSELTLTELISLSKKLPLQRLPSTYTLVASRSHL